AWTSEEVARFLDVTADHRWAVGLRLSVLYGLRRSELLALRWDDLAADKATLRIDEGLVPVIGGTAWTGAKNARSRRLVPLDDETIKGLVDRRRDQAADRLVAGAEWEDHDLVLTTRLGKPVMPRSYDRALDLVIAKAGLPRLSSHGLRPT